MDSIPRRVRRQPLRVAHWRAGAWTNQIVPRLLGADCESWRMRRIFLHGLDSSSHGLKARQLSALGVLTPDFQGNLEQRMVQLEPHLRGQDPWVLVGSSFGGLMAALWTLRNPHRVLRLILLAPALHRPEFAFDVPVQVPTWLFHGTRDSVVPHELATQRARAAFDPLKVHWVDDDHRLTATAPSLDWNELLLMK